MSNLWAIRQSTVTYNNDIITEQHVDTSIIFTSDTVSSLHYCQSKTLEKRRKTHFRYAMAIATPEIVSPISPIGQPSGM